MTGFRAETQLGVKNPRLAAEDILNGVLGLQKGAVTPFACKADTKNEVVFVLDKAMLEAGKSNDLLFHPLTGNTSTVVINTENLLK